MTQVDFYILQGSSPANREQFACRLAEKAYKLGHKIYIHTRDPQQAGALDKLLWTFKQNSFVPHGIDGQTPDPEAAVLIGSTPQLSNPEIAHSREVLINLASEVPLFFSSFARVAEMVDDDQQNKHDGRERFRFYRDRGYNLETHKL